jgi:hypothetical protein
VQTHGVSECVQGLDADWDVALDCQLKLDRDNWHTSGTQSLEDVS